MTFEDYAKEHLDRANLSHKGLELVRMGWNAKGSYGDDDAENLHAFLDSHGVQREREDGTPLSSYARAMLFYAHAQDGEAVPATEWLRCQLCGQMEPFHASGCNTEYGQYTHPGVSVPEGYVLVEKGITPTHVLEAGLECFRLLNQSGIADDRTLVLSVFQDMLLAIDKERATTPQPADNWIPCWDRMPTEDDADEEGNVWFCWADGQPGLLPWEDAAQRHTENFWMPTGLKRPNPPAEGAE